PHRRERSAGSWADRYHRRPGLGNRQRTHPAAVVPNHRVRGGSLLGSAAPPPPCRPDGPPHPRSCAPYRGQQATGLLRADRWRPGTEDVAERIAGSTALVPDAAGTGSGDHLRHVHQDWRAGVAGGDRPLDPHPQSGALVVAYVLIVAPSGTFHLTG